MKRLLILVMLFAAVHSYSQSRGYLGHKTSMDMGAGLHVLVVKPTLDLRLNRVIGRRTELSFHYITKRENLVSYRPSVQSSETKFFIFDDIDRYTYRVKDIPKNLIRTSQYGLSLRVFFEDYIAPVGPFIEIGFGSHRVKGVTNGVLDATRELNNSDEEESVKLPLNFSATSINVGLYESMTIKGSRMYVVYGAQGNYFWNSDYSSDANQLISSEEKLEEYYIARAYFDNIRRQNVLSVHVSVGNHF